jgi:hypothetical protein
MRSCLPFAAQDEEVFLVTKRNSRDLDPADPDHPRRCPHQIDVLCAPFCRPSRTSPNAKEVASARAVTPTIKGGVEDERAFRTKFVNAVQFRSRILTDQICQRSVASPDCQDEPSNSADSRAAASRV